MVPVALALALICLVVGFFVGAAVDTKQKIREHLRQAGFTKDGAKLFSRAAKILRRLDGLSALDGDFAPDILSDVTKKQVTEWLADYRKEISKV